jgi:hypothetical protein
MASTNQRRNPIGLLPSTQTLALTLGGISTAIAALLVNIASWGLPEGKGGQQLASLRTFLRLVMPKGGAIRHVINAIGGGDEQ